MATARGAAARVRSAVGRRVRAAGLLPVPPESFTPRQLEQLRQSVADALNQEAPPASAPHAILDEYAREAPSPQQAVDIFAGEWSSAFPADAHVEAGHAELFDDARVHLAVDWLAPRPPGRVLELGPLEGGHTYMLERAGYEVHAIESNARAYLKCLITKEILGLKQSRFSRGDFVEFLRTDEQTYDLVLASGVLYHMIQPLELLQLMAGRSDRLAIWTHYYDEAIVTDHPQARLFGAPPETALLDGVEYHLHPREYEVALEWGGFCGGPETYARWMERDEILRALRQLGFEDVQVHLEHTDHPNGPAFFLLASR